jgi:hypothetical protein
LKLPQLWKSTKVAFGDSLDDFHKPLEKASAQNASAFSQFQQARLNTHHLPPPLAEETKTGNGTYTKLRTDPTLGAPRR